MPKSGNTTYLLSKRKMKITFQFLSIQSAVDADGYIKIVHEGDLEIAAFGRSGEGDSVAREGDIVFRRAALDLLTVDLWKATKQGSLTRNDPQALLISQSESEDNANERH